MITRTILFALMLTLCGCASPVENSSGPVSSSENQGDDKVGAQGEEVGEDKTEDSTPPPSEQALDAADVNTEVGPEGDSEDSGGSGEVALDSNAGGQTDGGQDTEQVDADIVDSSSEGAPSDSNVLTEDGDSPSDGPVNAVSPSGPNQIRIVEFLPVGTADGALDPNGDGVSDASADEFIELVNGSDEVLNLEGVTLVDAYYPRMPIHTFSHLDVLPIDGRILVFGGGMPPIHPTSLVRVAHHTGVGTDIGLNLRNTGNRIEVRGVSGEVLDSVGYGTWGAVEAPIDASLVRMQDGSLVPHTTVSTPSLPFSPGEPTEGEWGSQ